MVQRQLRLMFAAALGLSLAGCSVESQPSETKPTGGSEQVANGAPATAEDVQEALRAIPDARVVGAEDGVPFFIKGTLGRAPEAAGDVRWMCSFDTTEEDVDGFVAALKEEMAR